MTSSGLKEAATLIYDGTYLFQFDVTSIENGAMIHDAVIDFYMKYLCRKWLNRDQRERVQMFQSVFADNNTKTFQNRFPNQLKLDKDFVIIPTLLDSHWFLVVVCYARNVLVDDFKPSEKPQVLIFDSAKSYLKSKRPIFIRSFRLLIQTEFARILDTKCDKIGNLTQKLPLLVVPTQQQDNDVDCGVFLIENVERLFNDKFVLGDELEYKVSTYTDPDIKRKNIKELIICLASISLEHIFDT